MTPAVTPQHLEGTMPGSAIWLAESARGPRHATTGISDPHGEVDWLIEQSYAPRFEWMAYYVIEASKRLRVAAQRAQAW